MVIGQLQREMERLKTELSFTQDQAQEQKEAFEEERLHWLDEKQKVGRRWKRELGHLLALRFGFKINSGYFYDACRCGMQNIKMK